MKVELKTLNVNDGEDIFEMIKEIGLGENGFTNSFPDTSFEDFKNVLPRLVDISEGNGLPEDYVPQTIYWMFVNDRPVAYGKLRHQLNDRLLAYGGNVGYIVRPSERGKGYGKLFLKELKHAAKLKGIDQLLITCDHTNSPSRAVIESNHGKLEEMKDGVCRYWIEL